MFLPEQFPLQIHPLQAVLLFSAAVLPVFHPNRKDLLQLVLLQVLKELCSMPVEELQAGLKNLRNIMRKKRRRTNLC